LFRAITKLKEPAAWIVRTAARESFALKLINLPLVRPARRDNAAALRLFTRVDYTVVGVESALNMAESAELPESGHAMPEIRSREGIASARHVLHRIAQSERMCDFALSVTVLCLFP
jgi:hypothetical protein